ncbi:glucosylglycerol hydrolase [Halegenticoccus soli]|uniref:glucosylglycerol hydrolase n=1 Tax=Halegenticoccus soli TaxID=1985678 RepID=UPI000C6DA8B0|nr:glucosylglycerol hydrolase [Halegenticoccus soli]
MSAEETHTAPRLLDGATADLLAWHGDVLSRHESAFEAAKELSTRLGAHRVDGRGNEGGTGGDAPGSAAGGGGRTDSAVEGDGSTGSAVEGDGASTAVARVGFWTPELLDADVPPENVFLEVLTPTEDVDLSADERTVTFRRDRVPLRRKGEYHWGVVEGMRPGTKERLGSLYQLVYEADGEWRSVTDPLAYSVPFGAFAPAEFYDLDRLDRERPDREYFESLGTADERVSTTEDDDLPRVDPAVSMLEIHPGTATESGTLAGLARRYEEIGRKVRGGEDLTPAERNFVGYDAIQLMPVEPITENENHPGYWRPQETDPDADELEVAVSRPDAINWGYDIVVSAFSATNPAVLETGRPDELVEFIAACHNHPEPIRVVFDVALGHADDGALELLNDYYFEGPGMYGQHLNYRHPTVRAILLEMQRRKMDFGADGIRVDGAQDFTYWDAEREENVHDDAFLAEMDAVVQEVAGTRYRPWMIYEDGRPWPREDWELASTYRALIEQHPHSFQWSPITFAHNTPALLTFWATKWWRVREVADFGGHWLTGVANHDTIRRGTQIDPTVEFNQSPVNPYLGETLPDTLDAAYNNPAASALFYCALPGVPMDFVHANMRAPWGFVRDTDAIWNVKVVSEESNFVDWQVRPEAFQRPEHFRRLKDLGFENREEVRTFIRALSASVDATDYDLDATAAMLSALDSPLGSALSPDDLEAFGYAWMRDVHDFANLAHWTDAQDDDRTAFDLSVRRFRHDREWLRDDLREGDFFTYRHPTEGTVLYYGLRESPDGDEQVLFAANMEGVPVAVSPELLDLDEASSEGWRVALSSPGVDEAGGEPFSLANGEAVVWTRAR